MKRLTYSFGLFSLITLMSSMCIAATLDFVPSTQTVKLGADVIVYLHVSDVGPGGTVDTAVSEFDIDATYDDPQNVLEFESVIFGPQLGDPTDPNETSINLLDAEGFVGLSETSNLSAGQLEALQGRGVSLVAVKFKAANIGTTTIAGDLFSLKDQFGNPLIGTHGPVGSATVTVVKGKKSLPISLP